MIPRLDIRFPIKRQVRYWCGDAYTARDGEYLLNHARTGIFIALRVALPNGGRVGVVVYNCYTVANAVVNAGCIPDFVDVCPDLKIDVDAIPVDLDAIVVSNLFGIRNDIAAIRKRCPKAIIIVDNAHGYGLPIEGDFTVYSIDQGKFPALGEGGLLMVNGERFKKKIDDLYKALPGYGLVAQCKLFIYMFFNAVLYYPWLYECFTKRIKQGRSNNTDHSPTIARQMASGIRRLYQAWLPTADVAIAVQKNNAAKIADMGYETIKSDNGYMAIISTDKPDELQKQFADKGIETATHFARAIDWAKEFGYVPGSCPIAEKLTHELLMVPTYKTI